jgi:hypothetical protein
MTFDYERGSDRVANFKDLLALRHPHDDATLWVVKVEATARAEVQVWELCDHAQ